MVRWKKYGCNKIARHTPEYRKMNEIGKVKLFALVNIIIATVSGVVGLVGRYVFLRSDNVTHTGGADLPAKVIITSEPVSALVLFDILIKISIVAVIIALIGVGYFIVKSKKKG